MVDTNPTSQVINLYSQLKNAQGNFIFFGQHMLGIDTNSFSITGKYPYIYGEDYHDTLNGLPIITEIRTDYLKKHHRNNGIVMLCWHMKNIVTDGNSKDESGGAVVNILPGGVNRSDYLAYLDGFASWCSSLIDDSGNLIPIIFRPLHESDGYSFWWARDGCTNSQYVSLWRDLVVYLRDTKGIHNLIYCYSPAIQNDVYLGARYPGDDYVDVFGISRYSDLDDIDTPIIQRYRDTYDASVLRNKVFMITEGMRDLVVAPKADYWTWYVNQILADDKARNASAICSWTSAKWGASSIRSDAPSFLEMSQNPKIKMLKYPTSIINNAVIRNAVLG